MVKRQIIKPIEKEFEEIVENVTGYNPNRKNNVFSNIRNIVQPPLELADGLKLNTKQQMDGLQLLKMIDDKSIPLVFFDPQYRTILDKQSYGNEGEGRQKARVELSQMSEKVIRNFIKEIERILIPSGHLMLWVDKFIICSGIHSLLEGSSLQLVDMVTWDKDKMGMGYRTRRYSEHLIIFQKLPVRAKGVWKIHDIPDVWKEKIENGDRNHTHFKPIGLQKRLIEAVTNKSDVIVDPAAGGYSVMRAANEANRNFLGCDIIDI